MGAPKGHAPYPGSEKGGRPLGSKNKNYLDPIGRLCPAAAKSAVLLTRKAAHRPMPTETTQ